MIRPCSERTLEYNENIHVGDNEEYYYTIPRAQDDEGGGKTNVNFVGVRVVARPSQCRREAVDGQAPGGGLTRGRGVPSTTVIIIT